MKKLLLLASVAVAASVLSGCGPYQITNCLVLEDGGPIGRHFDAYQKEDEYWRTEFKPTIKSYWKEEKTKWPIVRKSCIDGRDCDDDTAPTPAAK